MWNSNRLIKNIMGTPRKRGGRNDWDGDGVSNKKDCQPRNTMRQDRPTQPILKANLQNVYQQYNFERKLTEKLSNKELNDVQKFFNTEIKDKIEKKLGRRLNQLELNKAAREYDIYRKVGYNHRYTSKFALWAHN